LQPTWTVTSRPPSAIP